MAVALDNHVVRPTSTYPPGAAPEEEVIAEIISSSVRGVTQILQLTTGDAKRIAEDLVTCIRISDPKYKIR